VSDLSQIAHPDWLTAQHTDRLRAGRCAIHQDDLVWRAALLPKISGTVAHFRSCEPCVGRGGEQPLLAAGVLVPACEANPLGDGRYSVASVR